MTCRSCGADWCWLCNRVIAAGHYEGNNVFGCPGGQFDESPASCLVCFNKVTLALWSILMVLLFLPLFVAALAIGGACVPCTLACVCTQAECSEHGTFDRLKIAVWLSASAVLNAVWLAIIVPVSIIVFPLTICVCVCWDVDTLFDVYFWPMGLCLAFVSSAYNIDMDLQ
jgi:hypothetical protein